MINEIKTWQQGSFIEKREYRHWRVTEKEEAERQESLRVRPSPEGNAICQCGTPDDARWVAQRLNLASNLEKLCYDFAMGKTDGQEIIDFVRDKLE